MKNDCNDNVPLLAERSRNASRLGNEREAIELLDRTRQVAIPRNRLHDAFLLLASAEIKIHQGQLRQAENEAGQAAKLFEHLGSPSLRLAALEIPPRTWARRGEDERAAVSFEEILANWSALHGAKSLQGQVRCLTYLTHLHRRRSRFAEGLRTGAEALRKANKIDGDSFSFYSSANALAGVHFAQACQLHPATRWASHVTSLSPSNAPEVQRHCVSALRILERALEKLKGGESTYWTGLTSSNLGQVLVLLGRADDAIVHAKRFVEITKARDDQYMAADALKTLGWVYLSAGDAATAIEMLHDALRIATDLGARPLLGPIHYDMSTTYEALGDLQQALRHHREYLRIIDQHSTKTSAAHPSREHDKNTLEPFYLKRAEEFIRARLAAPPSAEEIAEYAGASIRAVQQAFKVFRSTTPQAFSVELRLCAAREQLIAKNAVGSVKEIGERFGFNDPSRFARDFAKRFGVLPSQLQRQYRSR